VEAIQLFFEPFWRVDIQQSVERRRYVARELFPWRVLFALFEPK
jgi:hypothetical protein